MAAADAVDVDLHFHLQGTHESSVCANQATDDRDRQYYELQNKDNAQDDKHMGRSPISVEFQPTNHATTFSIDSQYDWHSGIFVLLVLFFFFFVMMLSKPVFKNPISEEASNCSAESPSSDSDTDKNSKMSTQHQLNVKHKQLDTPRKIKLKRQISCLRKSVARFHAKKNSKKRVAKSTKAKINHIVGELQNLLPSSMHRFIEMQLQMSQVKNFGQQWKLTDKVFAMSIFYQSRKAYKLLQHIFVLPSPRTLQRTLQQSHLKPGFDLELFKAVGKRSSHFQNLQKIVC